jgi:hypothetical protein
MMDETLETIETLVSLDEPEQILPTLRKAAERKKGKRWQALASVLGEAEFKLDAILNAKPAQEQEHGVPDFDQTGQIKSASFDGATGAKPPADTQPDMA